MSRLGKFVKRHAKQAEGVAKKVLKYDPMAKQMGLGGSGGGITGGGDPAAPTDRGPQFSEEARRQAAGAGTVGFTQRTQNY